MRAVEPHAPQVEGDGVEGDFVGVGVDALEVERGGAEDALLGDVEGEIEREVLDAERAVALEVTGAMREGEGARGGGERGLVARGGAAAGVQTVRDGHGSSARIADEVEKRKAECAEFVSVPRDRLGSRA